MPENDPKIIELLTTIRDENRAFHEKSLRLQKGFLNTLTWIGLFIFIILVAIFLH
ncbi:hypothetical protein JD969_09475 [Planctomycetota bacterium]|nr:hypothetical protein JD969_09475 [Planctomycetota bacterium]